MNSRPGKLTRYFTRVAIDKCLAAIQTAMDDFPLPYTEEDKKLRTQYAELLTRYRNSLREERDRITGED